MATFSWGQNAKTLVHHWPGQFTEHEIKKNNKIVKVKPKVPSIETQSVLFCMWLSHCSYVSKTE